MAVTRWVEEGEPTVLAESCGKKLVEQRFKNTRTGRTNTRSLFSGRNSTVIFGLTPQNEVVAIRQFRFGSAKIQLELPAGNVDQGEEVLNAARREFYEETGFWARQLIWFFPGSGLVWVDPASLAGGCYPVLALDCKKLGPQKLDDNEEIEVVLVPLAEWESKTETGEVDGAMAIAVTGLALRYLRKQKTPI